MKKAFTVHDLPLSERPRERLREKGAEALSVQEVLALILGRGTRGEPVMVIAQALLSRFGDLRGLAAATVEELGGVDGIGPAKAAQIKAAFELARRLESYPAAGKGDPIKTPEDAVRVAAGKLKGKKREYFLALLLDRRNCLLRIAEISVGSLDSSIVHPREVFKEAIVASAASVIFVHNHPSGDSQPSAEDIAMTKRLAEVGEVMGIEVLDHVILGEGEFASLKDRRLF